MFCNVEFFITCIFILYTNIQCNLIDKSEFDQLRESMKHHLQYNKQFKKIPHDCSDKPEVEIDMVFKVENANTTTYYAVYGKEKYYIKIDGITKDHLPIVYRNTQPLPIDSVFQRIKLGKKPITEYEFVGPVYLYKVPSEDNKYRLVGFNQVWIGCPQPMCLTPAFDAAISLASAYGGHYHYHLYRDVMNSLITIFRGNYFWIFKIGRNRSTTFPPLTDSAQLIDERWIDQRVNTNRYLLKKQHEKLYYNDSMVAPTYMDAAVEGMNRYNSCIYFFKDKEFVCYEWYSMISSKKKISTEWMSSDNSWMSSPIDAAFHINSLIYFISGDKLWCFTNDRRLCHSYPKALKSLHREFPVPISSAFQINNYIYIINQYKYYKISANSFPDKIEDKDMVSKYIFKDLLGCNEALYTAWGFDNYDNFIDKFANRMQTSIETTDDNHTSSAKLGTNLVIIIVVLLFITIGVAIIWYIKPFWINQFVQTIKKPFVNN